MREAGGNNWLLGLRRLPYEDVRDRLLQLMGVGRKVADCVALFSLDKTDAVPVDTHVWDITQSLYAQHLQKTTKSLTPKMNDDIRGVWRQTFGSHSGWAQAILFAGELTRYRQLLQDNGCAPALGVAIKEERKESSASLSHSPHKVKSPLKSPRKGTASVPGPYSPPASQKAPKVERPRPSPGSGLESTAASASEVTDAGEAGSKLQKRHVAVRLKLGPGVAELEHSTLSELEHSTLSELPVQAAAAAMGQQHAAKKVKRERRA